MIKKLVRLIFNLFSFALRDFTTLKYKIVFKVLYPQVSFGKNIKIYGNLKLSIAKSARVIIGDGVVFRSHTKNYLGVIKPVSISVHENAQLVIGNFSGFSGTSIVASNSIIIGAYCNFGSNTSIWDTDFHPLDYRLRRTGNNGTRTKPIFVGDDVFVGAQSIILKGVTIGDRSIIGAASVVSRNIESDEIWGGNPARILKRIENK